MGRSEFDPLRRSWRRRARPATAAPVPPPRSKSTRRARMRSARPSRTGPTWGWSAAAGSSADGGVGGHYRSLLGDHVAGDVGAGTQLYAAVEDNHVAVDPPRDRNRGVEGGERSIHSAVHGGGAMEDD